MSQQDLDLSSIDALLAASMDDLEDLPPIGAPPSGHYNLTVTFDVEKIGEEGKEVVTASYIVDAINELKDPEEASDVAVGQNFKEFFHMVKRDGTLNKYGVGTLKQRLAVFADRAGTTNIGELVHGTKQMQVATTLKRTQNRKNEDQFNLAFKDMILL